MPDEQKTLSLSGLTAGEQQKFDLSLVGRLYDLQERDQLQVALTALLTTTKGHGQTIATEYQVRTNDTLQVAYAIDNMFSCVAPAHLLYDLAKDERVLRIDTPKPSRIF